MTDANRDHLFISYATEDSAFAEWLTLRLTNEGYRVWCDRVQLLGGESYPRDIDTAIKNRTFRFLAALSSHSLQKANPLKERTLALNLAAQRREDFVIPLNLSGLRSTDLDWMTSDITFIPFSDGWAAALAQLLKALHKADAPRPLGDGSGLVAQYIATRSVRKHEPERLWTNVIDINVPRDVLRVTGALGAVDRDLSKWPRYRENASVSWTFEIPDNATGIRTEPFDWRGNSPTGGLRLTNVVVNLLRHYIQHRCIEKGMSLSQDGGKFSQLHFTSDGSAAQWLSYVGHDGVKSRLKTIGQRNFWVGQDRRETIRYHLSPVFVPVLDLFGGPAFILRVRLHMTDLQGTPLPLAKAISRRKKICGGWWNHHWLARTQAILQLVTGAERTNLALTSSCEMSLLPSPRLLSVPEGIDEETKLPDVADDDEDLVDDEQESDD